MWEQVTPVHQVSTYLRLNRLFVDSTFDSFTHEDNVNTDEVLYMDIESEGASGKEDDCMKDDLPLFTISPKSVHEAVVLIAHFV